MSIPAYDFLAPRRIMFGWGRRREAGAAVATLGRRALLVCGSRSLEASGAIDEVMRNARSAGLATERVATIVHEPLVSDVEQAVARLVDLDAGAGDVVLAIGGGSAIDLAKAAAAIVAQRRSRDIRDYLEGVGKGLKLVESPLPIMVMPTTSGTGAEATKNAVISSLDPPFKKSLRADTMVPRCVLVDPELTANLPRETTAWTGMDAITQLIESGISRFAKPIATALATEGLGPAVRALPIVAGVSNHRASAPAHDAGELRAAREAMAHAALLSGMALANSGLGLAHGVAAALGVRCGVAHGLACAMLLPMALAVNRQVSQEPLANLARAAWEDLRGVTSAHAADALVERVNDLCDAVGVPRRLSDVGVRSDQLPAIVAGSRGNSMNGNPCEVDDERLFSLLEARL